VLPPRKCLDTDDPAGECGYLGLVVHDDLAALDRPAQITKKRYSAFIQNSSDVERHLRDRGIDTLLITGTATNVCCESSARDAMMLNFKVVMVSDGLATHTDDEHNATLSAFYGQFGDVQSVDELLQSLERGDKKKAAA